MHSGSWNKAWLAVRGASFAGLICLVVGFAAAAPAQAQEYSLFDRFSIGLGGGTLEIDTVVRLDATDGSIGTELDFEKNLALDGSQIEPAFLFEWHFARRHNLLLRYDSTGRNSATQVLTEIRFGDLVIPVDADVAVTYDIEEILVGYTYYPWLRDRWAAGFGLGLRLLDLTSTIEIVNLPPGASQIVLQERASATAPLPFLNFDYRYAIAPTWRFIGSLGLLDASIDDFKGSQTVAALNVEHLAWKNFSWGLSAGFSAVDVEAKDSDWVGRVKLDIIRLGAFVKGRW